MSIGERLASASAVSPVFQIARSLWHRLGKYWPEITAFVLMMAYTAVRTLLVAQGVDSVARTDWRIFLALEILFTVPYVWGIGDLVRGAMLGTHSKRRDWLGMVAVLSGVLVPYIYLAAFGGLQHVQSAVITVVMIALAMVGLRKSLKKLSRAKEERKERERALEERLSETQRLLELELLRQGGGATPETAVSPADERVAEPEERTG